MGRYVSSNYVTTSPTRPDHHTTLSPPTVQNRHGLTVPLHITNEFDLRTYSSSPYHGSTMYNSLFPCLVRMTKPLLRLLLSIPLVTDVHVSLNVSLLQKTLPHRQRLTHNLCLKYHRQCHRTQSVSNESRHQQA